LPVILLAWYSKKTSAKSAQREWRHIQIALVGYLEKKVKKIAFPKIEDNLLEAFEEHIARAGR